MRIESLLIWFLAIGLSAIMIAPPVIKHINLAIGCTDYLERAANANTPELAIQQLDTALAFIEKQGWTSGSTYVAFKYPQCDMGYWYANLVAARDELKGLSPKSSPLEKSNLLMKLRESITDGSGPNGKQELILPPNINFYPDQVVWVVWWWLGGALAVLFWIWAVADSFDY